MLFNRHSKMNILLVILATVAFGQLAVAFDQLGHLQVNEIYEGFKFNNDIDSCSRFTETLLARSGWQGPSDGWREAGMQLIEAILARSLIDGGLSIAADTKLVHCYQLIQEQVEILREIKQAAHQTSIGPILPNLNEALEGVELAFDCSNVAKTPKRRAARKSQTKPRKQRRVVGLTTRLELEKAYVRNPKPTRQEIKALAAQYSLDFVFVYGWFYNRRIADEQATLNKAASASRRQARQPKYKWLPRPTRIALETVFRANSYPSDATLQRLSEQHGVAKKKLQGWFAEKRTRRKMTNQLGT